MDREIDDPKNRLSAHSQKAMQRHIQMPGIPQILRRRKILNLGQRDQHFADQTRTMPPHQFPNRPARQQTLNPSRCRILVVFFHFLNQLPGMQRHQRLQFGTLDLSALKTGENFTWTRDHQQRGGFWVLDACLPIPQQSPPSTSSLQERTMPNSRTIFEP